MRVLGIDLAARPKKTDACLLHWSNGEFQVELHRVCDDAKLIQLARGCEKVAIDAPFGWPNEFVDALVAHRATEAWPAPDGESPEVFRASLSFRATDRVVMHTRRPLSVSTEKLGVTAMRCAHLLHRWKVRDRTGRGRFVEVYPAGALVRWGLEGSGYKGAQNEALGKLLGRLCKALPALKLDSNTRKMCATSDDAFDALVASLVARAAALGLTDGPPRQVRDRAAQEGWIHLPVRGSLPFLALPKAGLVATPAPALANKLGSTGIKVDRKGYVGRMEDVLLRRSSESTKRAIEADLSGKGGSELVRRGMEPPKFFAAHSSAALAANTFGPFLRDHAGVPIGRKSFTGEVALERECRTRLGGTPPTLDFLVEGKAILAVESKCIEPFSTHTARFSDAYADEMAKVHRTWREEYDRLVEDPTRYRHLDAAQLIKHYLGLKTQFGDRPVTLAYLYWRPNNAPELAPCAIHAAELEEFAARVADPKLAFVAISSSELWDTWSSSRRPKWLRQHAAALRRRYEVAV
jgi:predicted nuclease with RNAse H fold